MHYTSLLEISAALRAREISPVELTEAMLARIDALEPRLAAYATVTAESAKTQARKAEDDLARGIWHGPLHGVPIALKDIIDTAGVATAASPSRPAQARGPRGSACPRRSRRRPCR